MGMEDPAISGADSLLFLIRKCKQTGGRRTFETSSEDSLDTSWEHNQDTEVVQVIEDVAVASSAQHGSKWWRGLLGNKSDGPLDLDWW